MTLSEFRDSPAWVTIILKNGLTYRVPVLIPYLDEFLDGLNRGERVSSVRPLPPPDEPDADSSQCYFVNTCFIDGREVAAILVEYPPDALLYDILEELYNGETEED